MVDYKHLRTQRSCSIQGNTCGSTGECDESMNIRHLGQSIDGQRCEINALKNQILTDGMQVSTIMLCAMEEGGVYILFEFIYTRIYMM